MKKLSLEEEVDKLKKEIQEINKEIEKTKSEIKKIKKDFEKQIRRKEDRTIVYGSREKYGS